MKSMKAEAKTERKNTTRGRGGSINLLDLKRSCRRSCCSIVHLCVGACVCRCVCESASTAFAQQWTTKWQWAKVSAVRLRQKDRARVQEQHEKRESCAKSKGSCAGLPTLWLANKKRVAAALAEIAARQRMSS